jgi:hypothetical protein
LRPGQCGEQQSADLKAATEDVGRCWEIATSRHDRRFKGALGSGTQVMKGVRLVRSIGARLAVRRSERPGSVEREHRTSDVSGVTRGTVPREVVN